MSNRVVKSVPVKQGLYEISSTSKGDIGATMEFEDGRKYVYCLNGADTLTPGAVVQGTVLHASDDDLPLAVTAAIGDKSISVTTVREYTANQLKDGWLYVQEGTHLGNGRKIKSHPAAGAAETLVITFYDALNTILTAGDDVLQVVPNVYNGVLLQNAPDGAVIGVAPLDVTAAYYFWLQTKGVCPVITVSEAVTVGLDVDAKSATITIADGAGDCTIGRAMSTAATGDALLVDLNLT